MDHVTIRSEVVTSVDSYIVRTLAGRNRIFSQGKALKRIVITATGIESGQNGKTANFYTSAGSGSGRISTESGQSSSGSPYPVSTIETLLEDG